MREFSDEEIQNQLTVRGGTEEEQAAAKAVVVAAIQENLSLGRLAKGSQKSTWSKNRGILRSEISNNWKASSRPGLD
ncbi:MAG: hypothetical protein RIQ37_80 [Actinomycetota bacterium]|jgi:hypothetical protein